MLTNLAETAGRPKGVRTLLTGRMQRKRPDAFGLSVIVTGAPVGRRYCTVRGGQGSPGRPGVGSLSLPPAR